MWLRKYLEDAAGGRSWVPSKKIFFVTIFVDRQNSFRC